jgi:hypothetical protein
VLWRSALQQAEQQRNSSSQWLRRSSTRGMKQHAVGKLKLEWRHLGGIIRNIKNYSCSITPTNFLVELLNPQALHEIKNTNQLSKLIAAVRLANTIWRCPAVVKTMQNTRTQLVH